MPRVKPGERKRAKRPKTKTGCLTCKVRRVKCDEARPSCLRCTSTGRKCDGYESTIAAFPPLTVQAISQWGGPAALQEKRAFKFFCEITSEQLSGSSDRGLWSCVLLQAAYEDVGIRHAIIALGTLHEYFINTGEAERVKDDFALRQYNLAIRRYIDNLSWDSSKQVTSYIVACILFICIELLQGHYKSALSLINSSVQLFYDQSPENLKTSPWPLGIIELILSRLQTQVMGLVGSSAMSKPQTPRMRSAESLTMPPQFQSVDEAKDYFEYYYHTYALGGHSLVSKDFGFYANQFRSWKAAFDALITSLGPGINKRDERIAKFLTLRQLMMAIPIEMAMKPDFDHHDATTWDRYVAECEKVVELAESLLQDSAGGGVPTGAAPFHFTLEVGLVGPLYDISWGCRDPVVRRKAIALLRKYPRREGLWDSVLASHVAERRMELEESTASDIKAAADVPSWARIETSIPTFQVGERQAIVNFAGQRPPWGGGHVHNVSHIVQW